MFSRQQQWQQAVIVAVAQNVAVFLADGVEKNPNKAQIFMIAEDLYIFKSGNLRIKSAEKKKSKIRNPLSPQHFKSQPQL